MAGLPLMVTKPVETEQPKQITPAQAKVEAIASLTMSAYQKAATLQLSKEETAMLQEDFPDEAFRPGAAGKEHLLYIEHAFLRDRFVKVFGMGGWAIIPRNRWAEPFVTQKGVEGSRVYVEAMLVVRGAFVAEAVGEMEYYPKNPAQNYGDAVEGAKTAAFRRCAKEFGVGLQAWKTEWCHGWWERMNAKLKGKPASKPADPEKPKIKAFPDEEDRAKFIKLTENDWEKTTQYCIDIAWLMPNEPLKDIPLKHVPLTQGQFNKFIACRNKWEETGVAEKPYPSHPEPDKPSAEAKPEDEVWRSYPMPFGEHKGMKMEDVPKEKLFGWCMNYKVEKTFVSKKDGKTYKVKPDQLAKNIEFREMLDKAREHYKFGEKD